VRRTGTVALLLLAVLGAAAALIFAASPNRPGRYSVIDAGFEHGLRGWNTSGAGDAVPTVVADRVREGSHSARVRLTGGEGRSELILASPSGAIFNFHEGDTYYYGFSFYVVSMDWGHPGAHNIIWQLHQRGVGNTGSPPLALALLRFHGHRGLWSESAARRVDRFLRPIRLHRWYDVTLRFVVSSHRKGSYRVWLDRRPVDAGSRMDTLLPGFRNCMIQTGLYRNANVLRGASEIRLDAARLGSTFARVQVHK
jgi:Polysaccharide lyase